jgi:hypothetical protein
MADLATLLLQCSRMTVVMVFRRGAFDASEGAQHGKLDHTLVRFRTISARSGWLRRWCRLSGFGAAAKDRGTDTKAAANSENRQHWYRDDY